MKIISANGLSVAEYTSVRVSAVYDAPRDIGGNLIGYNVVGTLPFGKDIVIKQFGVPQHKQATELLDDISSKFDSEFTYKVK